MLRRVRAWLAPEAQPPQPERDETRVDELAARLQTVARAQSKLSLRLDELATQIETNHGELLARLAGGGRDRLDDVLDALDRLDDAVRALGAEQRSVADGLGAIGARLERFVAGCGVVRHASVGVVPDGRRFRIVGTERRDDLPDGVITRVVRAAATRGDELLREGEVLINRGSPP